MPKLSKSDRLAKVSANEARRRKEVALAEIREMERDQKRGVLLPAATVRKVWAERLSALKDRALMLPDPLSARLAGRSEGEVRLVLRDEIEECLGIRDGGSGSEAARRGYTRRRQPSSTIHVVNSPLCTSCSGTVP